MENRRLVLLHTVRPLVNVFAKLCAELLGGASVMHVLDEPLLERIRRRGHLAPEDSQHVQTHVELAEEIGAAMVLVTCSTVSPCVDQVAPRAGIPVHRIDDEMISQAIATGPRIGIIATNPTTLVPTHLSLAALAEALGKSIETDRVLVVEALDLLMRGDGDAHDRLVKAALLDLSERVDVVVLAQASMARVLNVIPASACSVPVLSSPHLALARVKRLLWDAKGAAGD